MIVIRFGRGVFPVVYNLSILGAWRTVRSQALVFKCPDHHRRYLREERLRHSGIQWVREGKAEVEGHKRRDVRFRVLRSTELGVTLIQVSRTEVPICF